MTILKKQLGAKVKEIRKSRKLTQSKLAEKVGLSTNMIGYIERGDRFPSAETFMKLADALEVEVMNLFAFSPENAEADAERRAAEIELGETLKDVPTVLLRHVNEIIRKSHELI